MKIGDKVITDIDVPCFDFPEDILPKGTEAKIIRFDGKYITILPVGTSITWDVYRSDITIVKE